MGTVRQEMMLRLEQGPLNVRELSQALGIREKEVVPHLPHIAKSVVAKGMRFEVLPAYCENCDFTFSNRKRLTRPGKCPRCRQARIQGPWYSVVDKPQGG